MYEEFSFFTSLLTLGIVNLFEFSSSSGCVVVVIVILICISLMTSDFPGGSDGKASVYNAGDPGSIPGLGRSPGEGNGNPLQYYCLENPMDRGAW